MSSSSSLSSVSSSFDGVFFSSAGLVEGFSLTGFCVDTVPAGDRGRSSTTSATKVDDMGGGKCRWNKRKILLNAIPKKRTKKVNTSYFASDMRNKTHHDHSPYQG
jgi:hypothetical protein